MYAILSYTKHAKEMGADGVLLVSPYYNKPSQEGLSQHYKKIAETFSTGQLTELFAEAPESARFFKGGLVMPARNNFV